MNGSPATATPLSSAARQETFLAVRNALKLGASLICTWGTALAVLALDALTYVAVALALRAVDVRAIARFVASAMEARRQGN
jgi:hypothetical protein